MPRWIRRRNGQFNGSIGDGVTAPTAVTAPVGQQPCSRCTEWVAVWYQTTGKTGRINLCSHCFARMPHDDVENAWSRFTAYDTATTTPDPDNHNLPDGYTANFSTRSGGTLTYDRYGYEAQVKFLSTGTRGRGAWEAIVHIIAPDDDREILDTKRFSDQADAIIWATLKTVTLQREVIKFREALGTLEPSLYIASLLDQARTAGVNLDDLTGYDIDDLESDDYDIILGNLSYAVDETEYGHATSVWEDSKGQIHYHLFPTEEHAHAFGLYIMLTEKIRQLNN